MKKKNKFQYLLWFEQVGKEDGGKVGGKGANLGEMASFGIPVPKGFVVTSRAYFEFLDHNQLRPQITNSLKDIVFDRPETYQEISKQIKKNILGSKIPAEIEREIIKGYAQLSGRIRQALVAVRSSATAEDLPEASFAGQQATYLNISGKKNVVRAVKDCWASLFEPRAIFYRQEKDFDHLKVGMAVPVQEMVPADVSGVMFTLDPVTNDKKVIVIEAIYGLGEYIVQGKVTPDRYLVNKKPLEVIKTDIAPQKTQLIKVGSLNKNAVVPKKYQYKRKLTNPQIIKLAELGVKIHQHYFFPQDIEWALGKNKIWILQTRPVTTIKPKAKDQSLKTAKRKVILKGSPACPGAASGPVNIMKSAREINKIKNGDVLVTTMTTPDFVPAMKKAVAVVTDKGGQTSHAAIVSRELGIPCVVGTEEATKKLKNGQVITVNGALGEIYSGGIRGGRSKSVPAFQQDPNKDIKSSHLKSVKTATKVYVNLGEPELASQNAAKNVDGVGLLRAEFMMAQIGVHPKKAIKDRKQKKYVDQLATNLATFCENFYPRPVVYRSSDFKTNEYRSLTGGKAYEPEEANPFIGYRGAFRYLADPRVFELELQAIKIVRNQKGLKNLWLMVPFCRTPQELAGVKKLVVGAGLNRSPSFKFWLMVEIPANVILLKEFASVGIDGISIGSNDLTMLLLGIDRDNEDLAQTFDERNPAVLWALEKTIKNCQGLKITSSICGQAPSVYPDLVKKLVDWGITSVSVNPDAIERTRELVYQSERELVVSRSR